MRADVLHGDCLAVLATLPAESVACCVTSPPYWGLRDYGHAGQIGLESTPEAYVARLVEVFREVRRVLRADGTLWLNLGDSYNAYNGNRGRSTSFQAATENECPDLPAGFGLTAKGLKPKDLVGIPWRVAFALQADGWYLRSDIIWAKPNPMPESVTDRPTKAHEYVFLFAKGQQSTRTVQLADVPDERIHFRERLTGQYSRASTLAKLCVGLASAISDCPELQDCLRLSALDAQIRQYGAHDLARKPVVGLPAEHRALADAATGLLYGDVSTKQFLQEMQRLGLRLGQHHSLVIGGVDVQLTGAPSVYTNGDCAVAINDSGNVCKFDFLHGRIVSHAPTTCKYWYDADALREPHESDGRGGFSNKETLKSVRLEAAHAPSLVNAEVNPLGRNARTVWTIATQPFSGAHFATFPPELARRCILAGCPAGGTVLDPFAGSGTTGAVAIEEGREFTGIELNPAYCALAEKRLRGAQPPLFAKGGAA